MRETIVIICRAWREIHGISAEIKLSAVFSHYSTFFLNFFSTYSDDVEISSLYFECV